MRLPVAAAQFTCALTRALAAVSCGACRVFPRVLVLTWRSDLRLSCAGVCDRIRQPHSASGQCRQLPANSRVRDKACLDRGGNGREEDYRSDIVVLAAGVGDGGAEGGFHGQVVAAGAGCIRTAGEISGAVSVMSDYPLSVA